MGFIKRARIKTTYDASEDVSFVLRQLASVHKCVFISDLPQLFRKGTMKCGTVPVRGFELLVWDEVLTYLSGTPQSFETHDEVDRMLGN